MNESNSGRKLGSAVEPLLTAKEVGELLHLSADSIVKYARRRVIPSIRVGRFLRFRPEAIRRFLDRHSFDEQATQEAETGNAN